jgi:hypothetical protein
MGLMVPKFGFNWVQSVILSWKDTLMSRPNSQLNLEFFPETVESSDLTKPATDVSKVQTLRLVCESEVPIYTETTPILWG